MIHADGTMDVWVDGKLERRPYTRQDSGSVWQRYEPDYSLEHEHVVYQIGSDIPTIVRIRG